MKSSDKTEVLVVGAGPVGMFTALRLALHGIHVHIIDQGARTAGHSYACALHPGSLQHLDEVGIAADAIDAGFRIDGVGFYEGKTRRAEAKISGINAGFPYAMALPQSGFEDLLAERLKQLPNVRLDWHHRLADLKMDQAGVTATVEKLGFTGKGMIVPEFELVVEKAVQVRAEFVIGADGHASVVRNRLDIRPEYLGEPELFVVYEMETIGPLDHEMKVVLDDTTSSVVWPLGENRCRWSFQLKPADPPGDFPEKDRNSFIVQESGGREGVRQRLRNLLDQRAPWFKAGVGKVGWATDIQFDHWSARPFGRERCWLVGDAAHQTGPLGMHSMNIGLSEAVDLAGKIKKILRNAGSLDLLNAYDLDHSESWQKLLRATGTLKTKDDAAAWTRKNSGRILASLPASGRDLTQLLGQLGIEWV